jgi:hypothetical protein
MRPVARRGGDRAASLQSTLTPTRSPVCDARRQERDAQGGRLHGPKQRRRGLVGAATWRYLASVQRGLTARGGPAGLPSALAVLGQPPPRLAELPFRLALASRALRRRRQARRTSPSRRGHARAGAFLQLGAGAGLPCVPADPVVGPSWLCARCRRRPIAACSSPLLLGARSSAFHQRSEICWTARSARRSRGWPRRATGEPGRRGYAAPFRSIGWGWACRSPRSRRT